MSEERKHIKFTAADIEKYHKGLLSGPQMHALEKAALDDPFLAEALDGYAIGKSNAIADIEDLKNRLDNRIQGGKIVTIPSVRKQKYLWPRVAAMIILVAGAALLVYQYSFNKKSTISQLDRSGKKESTKDSISSAIAPVSNDTIAQKNEFEQLQKDNTANSTIERKVESTAGNGIASADKRSDSTTVNQPVTANDEEPAILDEYNQDLAKQKKIAKEDQADKKIEEQPVVSTAPKTTDSKARTEAQGLGRQRTKQNDAQVKALSNNTDYPYVQTNAFRGRVTDPNNKPVPFANITNTRDNVNTYADASGYFNLLAPDSVLNVEVRSVGFENNNTQVRSDLTNNQIVLQGDRNALNEVIVINKNSNAGARAQKVPVTVEEPEPADGWENYDTYLLNNVNIPEEAKAKSLNGNVSLSFDITKKGNPINIKVEKSLCQSCDQEAIRVVLSGPKWKKKTKKARASVKVPF